MKSVFRCLTVAASLAGAVSAFGAARPDVLAIYYPHWHVYPKGNEWFHPGWTEWEYVRDSPPRFPGHWQPLVPVHGYLDGKDPQDVAKEIDLAADAGIDVFLYDYYYYNGEVTQEEALEQGFLKAKNRSRMKFAIMWCYHDRSMGWRPSEKTAERKKLMVHDGTPGEFLGLIDLCIKRYFPRPEHYRKNGALYFSFYNPWGFIEKVGRDQAKAAFAEARRRVRAAGLGEIHFNGQGGRIENTELMKDVGFDSLTDYVFGVFALKEYKERRDRGEWLYDFGAIGPQLEAWWRKKGAGPLPYYPIVPTGWDTSARMRPDVQMPVKGPGLDYPYTGIYTNATAEHFERYLAAAKRFAAESPQRDLVQINAWNEYTEGCWLVPDNFEGDAKLRAIEKVFGVREAAVRVLDPAAPLRDLTGNPAGAGFGFDGDLGESVFTDADWYYREDAEATAKAFRSVGARLVRQQRALSRFQGERATRLIRLEKDRRAKRANAARILDPKVKMSWTDPKHVFELYRKAGMKAILCLDRYAYDPAKDELTEDPEVSAKAVGDFLKWIIANGYKDLVVGFEMENESYYRDNPEQYGERWRRILPEMRRLWPDVKVGCSLPIYVDADPDLIAVRDRARAEMNLKDVINKHTPEYVNKSFYRQMTALGDEITNVTHAIIHVYGATPNFTCSYTGILRARAMLKAFPMLAGRHFWITEWRERSVEDLTCQRAFRSALWKATFMLMTLAQPDVDASCLHNTITHAGVFHQSTGKVWQRCYERAWGFKRGKTNGPRPPEIRDTTGVGRRHLAVGAAGAMFSVVNPALDRRPLVLGYGSDHGFLASAKYYSEYHTLLPKKGLPVVGDTVWTAVAEKDLGSVALVAVNTRPQASAVEVAVKGFRPGAKGRLRLVRCPDPSRIDELENPNEVPPWTIEEREIAVIGPTIRLDLPRDTVAALVVDGCAAEPSAGLSDTVELEPGAYGGHLQDVTRDGDFLYWAHTRTILKTDLRGKVLASVRDAGHNAGCQVRDGRLYVAVCSKGGVVRPEDREKHRLQINVYDAGDLRLLERRLIEGAHDRAGSLAILPDGSFVVGCLRPPDVRADQVRFYRISRDFKVLSRHELDGLPVRLGIEVVKYHRGDLWLFSYGGKTVRLDAATLAEKGRYDGMNGTLGAVFEGDGFWCGKCDKEVGAKFDQADRSKTVFRSSLTRTPVRVSALAAVP